MDFRLALAGEFHRAGGIDDEVGAEVGIGLEFLDVEAVGAGEGLPIEAAGIVAGDIFPVFGELDGRPAVGRAVFAGHIAEHRHARLDGQRGEPGKQVVVDEGIAHSVDLIIR